MLDLNHPQTEHIFRASAYLDALLKLGQLMTVSPSSVRADLVGDGTELIAGLRGHADAHFADATAIPAALDDLLAGFEKIAALGGGTLTGDARDGDGPCPACGTTVTKFDAYARIRGYEPNWIICCDSCTELFMPQHHRLCSGDCFATEFI